MYAIFLYRSPRRYIEPYSEAMGASGKITDRGEQFISPYTLSIGQQLSIPPGVDLYRVQSGDSVYRISQQYGVPIALIAEENKLMPPYILHVGQLLKIPRGVPYYVVHSGDTLNDIARRYNVTTAGKSDPGLIQRVNELPSSTIQLGMKLTIPYDLAGDYGFIAYTSNRGGQFDIWTINFKPASISN